MLTVETALNDLWVDYSWWTTGSRRLHLEPLKSSRGTICILHLRQKGVETQTKGHDLLLLPTRSLNWMWISRCGRFFLSPDRPAIW